MFGNSKLKFAMTEAEVNVCIKGLILFRNELMEAGNYTDVVDELILRLAK